MFCGGLESLLDTGQEPYTRRSGFLNALLQNTSCEDYSDLTRDPCFAPVGLVEDKSESTVRRES